MDGFGIVIGVNDSDGNRTSRQDPVFHLIGVLKTKYYVSRRELDS